MGKCHYPTIDSNDLDSIRKAVDDGWFTHGKRCNEFERRMAAWIGTKYGFFVSSGSSASLLAIASLTSWKLGKDQLRTGQEVITTALAFPTTVAPIVQHGLIPVFVDVKKGTLNASVEDIEQCITKNTGAVVVANTLGNPIDPEIRSLCDKRGVWLVEDNCDGLGGEVNGRKTGTIGHLSTLSFYPAHHITTGEGGMVLTDDSKLASIVRSMMNWGRDCICQGGEDGKCGRRFEGQHGFLPKGYDHKYVFSHFGYNLKNTELAAALGMSQMDKLDSFVEARKRNWERYRERLEPYSDVLGRMAATPGSSPSWFGYCVICNPRIDRTNIIRHLEKHGIQTRMLFAGNILRQPCFQDQSKYITVSTFDVTDDITNNAFWLGVAPSVTEEQIDKTCSLIIEYITQ